MFSHICHVLGKEFCCFQLHNIFFLKLPAPNLDLPEKKTITVSDKNSQPQGPPDHAYPHLQQEELR